MNTRVRLLALLLGLAAAVWPGPVRAGDRESEVPEPLPAHQVIVRGRKTLARSLISACAPAWARRKRPREITLVVDPVRSLADVEERFVAALVALEARALAGGRWSLATLGRSPEASGRTPSALGPALHNALKPRNLIVDTITYPSGYRSACPSLRRVSLCPAFASMAHPWPASGPRRTRVDPDAVIEIGHSVARPEHNDALTNNHGGRARCALGELRKESVRPGGLSGRLRSWAKSPSSARAVAAIASTQ